MSKRTMSKTPAAATLAMPAGLVLAVTAAILVGTILTLLWGGLALLILSGDGTPLASWVYVPALFSTLFFVASIGIIRRRDWARQLAFFVSLFATPLYWVAATVTISGLFDSSYEPTFDSVLAGMIYMLPHATVAMAVGTAIAYYLTRTSVRAYCTR